MKPQHLKPGELNRLAAQQAPAVTLAGDLNLVGLNLFWLAGFFLGEKEWMKYTKPQLSFEEQAQLFLGRGLIVPVCQDKNLVE